MDHHDHVELLRDGIEQQGGRWADFGSGTGAFTLALAELIGAGSTIYSLDRDGRALREQERQMRQGFPGVSVEYRTADFARPLDLPPLDGAVMANALHFHRNKDAILQLLHGYLKPGGRFLLVEYNVDQGNMWVPHPLSYPTWEKLAGRNGFVGTRLIGRRPSRFLKEIYSAVSQKP
ncbi:MAG: class I SAM-dependent methyltransferase [bacterium]|nr:class I SAM-dependent methyltransferase [bacterium]